MFYTDGKLQYKVRVDRPNPMFAKMLQQAIGGIEGEIRVCLQYLFQAWGCRGPKKYRDLLLETGTEEMAHIEMLSTAVALNLQGASEAIQEGVGSKNPVTAAILGGMSPRHALSSGLNAMPVNSEGVPFDCSHVYATGNIAADMYANVTAEAGGRVLATRLYAMTDDPGMKDMLKFLIARDTMHQQQWLAALEELGAEKNLPIPNSFPRRRSTASSATRSWRRSSPTASARRRGAGRTARRSTARASSPHIWPSRSARSPRCPRRSRRGSPRPSRWRARPRPSTSSAPRSRRSRRASSRR